MTTSNSQARAEINVCLFLIVVCLVVLWESRLIPPGSFEPLGSAPIPQATASLIILLCVITVVRAFRHDGATDHTAVAEQEDTHEPRYMDALAVLFLTLVYCAVLHTKAVTFSLTTVVFLFVTMGLLVRFKPRAMVTVAIISVVMGFGSQYIFTKIFVVDLPGAF